MNNAELQADEASILRAYGASIENEEERVEYHARLSMEEMCCIETNCFDPIYIGSVCSYHSRTVE